MPIPRRLPAASLGSALLALLVACNGGPDSPISPSPAGVLTIDDLALSVSAPGRDGIRRNGQAPPSSGGPFIDATGNSAIVNGGTLAVDIAASAPFTTVYVAVNVPTEGLATATPGFIEGYFEVPLASPQIAASLLLAFPQDITLSEFDLGFAVAGPDGVVGSYVPLTITVIQVGTGDVQVTLSWDANSDVDLHVVAPNGEEIYFGNPDGANGGTLDLDSNAGCNIDGVRNENITWPSGQAPAGTYIVRVDYWDSCGVPETNYTVRVNNGGQVQVVTGQFTGPGDQGGAGAGVTVATFTRSSGTTISSFAVQPRTAQGATKSLAAPGGKP